jgi:hypothetical protein
MLANRGGEESLGLPLLKYSLLLILFGLLVDHAARLEVGQDHRKGRRRRDVEVSVGKRHHRRGKNDQVCPFPVQLYLYRVGMLMRLDSLSFHYRFIF